MVTAQELRFPKESPLKAREIRRRVEPLPTLTPKRIRLLPTPKPAPVMREQRVVVVAFSGGGKDIRTGKYRKAGTEVVPLEEWNEWRRVMKARGYGEIEQSYATKRTVSDGAVKISTKHLKQREQQEKQERRVKEHIKKTQEVEILRKEQRGIEYGEELAKKYKDLFKFSTETPTSPRVAPKAEGMFPRKEKAYSPLEKQYIKKIQEKKYPLLPELYGRQSFKDQDKFYITGHGQSMYPTLSDKETVLVEKYKGQEIPTGTIIGFEYPETKSGYAMHRVTGRGKMGEYLTFGDNRALLSMGEVVEPEKIKYVALGRLKEDDLKTRKVSEKVSLGVTGGVVREVTPPTITQKIKSLFIKEVGDIPIGGTKLGRIPKSAKKGVGYVFKEELPKTSERITTGIQKGTEKAFVGIFGTPELKLDRPTIGYIEKTDTILKAGEISKTKVPVIDILTAPTRVEKVTAKQVATVADIGTYFVPVVGGMRFGLDVSSVGAKVVTKQPITTREKITLAVGGAILGGKVLAKPISKVVTKISKKPDIKLVGYRGVIRETKTPSGSPFWRGEYDVLVKTKKGVYPRRVLADFFKTTKRGTTGKLDVYTPKKPDILSTSYAFTISKKVKPYTYSKTALETVGKGKRTYNVFFGATAKGTPEGIKTVVAGEKQLTFFRDVAMGKTLKTPIKIRKGYEMVGGVTVLEKQAPEVGVKIVGKGVKVTPKTKKGIDFITGETIKEVVKPTIPKPSAKIPKIDKPIITSYATSRVSLEAPAYDPSQYQRTEEYGVFVPSQITQQKIIQAPKTTELSALGSISLLRSLQKPLEIQKQQQKQQQFLRVEQAPTQVQKERQALKQILRQQQKQIQRQRQKQLLRTQTLLRTTPTTPPTTIRIPPLLLPSLVKKKKLKVLAKKVKRLQLFQPLIKRRGEWIELGKPLPKGKALRLGAKRTRETLGATFKVEPTGKFRFGRDIPFKPSPKIFRGYKIRKGQKILLQDKFIQRRGTRLGTFGEVSEIQQEKRRKEKGGKKKKSRKKGRIRWLS